MRRLLAPALVAGSLTFGPACRDARKSDTMSAPDVSSKPSAPAGDAPVVGGPLAQIVARAATGEGSGPRLRFQRGHELSGITTFTVGEDGAYTLERTSRRGGPPASFAGTLDGAQRQALFGAVERGAVLALTSSSRPLGDDEQPINLELDGGGERFALTLWAEDARDDPRFGQLTTVLYPLLDQLSAGTIRLKP